MSYEYDLSIDENSLEEEWLGQPGLYFKYSKLLAEAEEVKNKAKDNLILTAAELDESIREELKQNGEKITEKIVETKVIQSVAYIDAQGKLIEAIHEHQILKGAITSLEHRKSALENLVKLWLGGYYSEPKAKEGNDLKEKTKKKTQTKARKKLNKKEKK